MARLALGTPQSADASSLKCGSLLCACGSARISANVALQVELAEHTGLVGGLDARERCVDAVGIVGEAVFLELSGVHAL